MSLKNLSNHKEMSIYAAITYYYKDLMFIARREYYKIYSKKSRRNEDGEFKDIAHDTILKMCNTFDGIETTITHIKAYFCKAVKMNYIKDLISLKPKYVPSFSGNTSTDDNVCANDSAIDFDYILSDVDSVFGKTDCRIYKEFYEGYTLRELDKTYGINNSAYIVRKIKAYVREKFPEYKPKRITKPIK